MRCSTLHDGAFAETPLTATAGASNAAIRRAHDPLSAFGVPHCFGAEASDGFLAASRGVTYVNGLIGYDAGDPQYVAGADVNLDGQIDSADHNRLTDGFLVVNGGRGNFTRDNKPSDIRVTDAGYRIDPTVDLHHVRNRVSDAELGRWTRRDPLGYAAGLNLYAYAESPVAVTDPSGLLTVHSRPVPRSAFDDDPDVACAPGGIAQEITFENGVNFDAGEGREDQFRLRQRRRRRRNQPSQPALSHLRMQEGRRSELRRLCNEANIELCRQLLANRQTEH